MAKKKVNPALMRPLTPSANLAALVGSKALPRAQAIKKVWDYIKKEGLQDSKNKRNINCDAKLSAVCGKKKQVSMFELAKFISSNLK